MALSLILAEKPSQGKDLAKGLNELFTQHDGYLEGKNHIVTWAFGHLVSLAEPTAYDERFAKWRYEDLPIIPAEFQYQVKEKGKKQFNLIKTLVTRSNVERIIIATDPGREGELIARLILKMVGNQKPVMRFWTSKALTPSVVAEEFRKLKPASQYDPLYQSALARQRADWLVGLNATRAFSVRSGEMYSLGRVQTPVLAILARREEEILAHQPQDYWMVKAVFKHSNGTYEGVWFNPGSGKDHRELSGELDQEEEKREENREEGGNKIFDLSKAKEIKERLVEKGTIQSVDLKKKSEKPPHLFSLTTLQQEANKLFGFSAKKTLEMAQTLYESHKAISYPRTESQHLNEEMETEVKKIVDKLAVIDYNLFKNEPVTISKENKAVFDSGKLTDHHALIPTGINPGKLPQEQEQLFKLILKRFAAVFCPDHLYQTTTIITQLNANQFKTTGRTIQVLGWKRVYGVADKETPLPQVRSKDPVDLLDSSLDKKETKPPERYTDASILSAMAHAQRFVTDPALKQVLKETAGLGTPATRANILEILINREYVIRKKKTLIPTDKGIQLITQVKDEMIADPGYTALWELKLENIAKGGENSVKSFQNGIETYTREIVKKAVPIEKKPGKEEKPAGSLNPLGSCPECQKPVYENQKAYSCSGYKEGCKFTLWKDSLARLGKNNLSGTIAKQLLAGKTVPLRKLKGKGKLFDADGRLSKNDKYGWTVELIFNR